MTNINATNPEVECIEPDPPADERAVTHALHVFKAKPENAERVKLYDAFGRWYFADGGV